MQVDQAKGHERKESIKDASAEAIRTQSVPAARSPAMRKT